MSDSVCAKWKEIIESNNIELIKNYIESNDIHYFCEYPLRFSARNGFSEAVKLLIETGANIHIHDDAPIFWAAVGNHLDVVKTLIEHGANVHVFHDHPIRYAVERGRSELVRILITAGADIHISNNSLICMAALKGHCDVVRILIDSGANINAQHGLPLKLAVRDSKFDVVKLLVECGSLVNNLSSDEKEKMDWILKLSSSKLIKPTTELCLINHTEIGPGEEYYICSNNSEHIYSKISIDTWKKGTNCLICFKPLITTIYINQ